MSQPTGAQSGTEPTATQSGGSGGSASTSTEGTGTEGTGTQSGTPPQPAAPAEDTVSRADYEAIQNRMRGADQRAAQFEAKLKELQQKDLPEAEKLKAEHEAAVQRVQQLSDTNRTLTLENAFLKDNTHEWKNPGVALKLADLSGVTIDDTGHVIGLKDALKKLANSEPYLLKDKAASDGGSAGSSGGTGAGSNPASAGVPPMNGKPDSNANSNKGMETRLPALLSRRRPS